MDQETTILKRLIAENMAAEVRIQKASREDHGYCYRGDLIYEALEQATRNALAEGVAIGYAHAMSETGAD